MEQRKFLFSLKATLHSTPEKLRYSAPLLHAQHLSFQSFVSAFTQKPNTFPVYKRPWLELRVQTKRKNPTLYSTFHMLTQFTGGH